MSKTMDNICRFCLLYKIERANIETELDEEKMLPIFKVLQGVEEHCLKELIKTTVPQLKIMENDQLPKNTCKACSEKIIDIYNFQQMCLKNEEKLYKLLEFRDIDILFDNLKNRTKIVPKTDIVNYILNQIDSFELTHEIDTDFIEDNSIYSSNVLICGENTESSCKLNSDEIETIINKSNKSLKKNIKKSLIKTPSKCKRTNTKKLYSCDKCQRKLKSKISLTKHQEMHFKKDKEAEELKCGICKQVFPDISIFKNHQQQHLSEKPFLCSECGKSFTSAGSLKQHSFRHLDKKLYQCSECPKSFPTNGDLLCHYETHNAKPRIHVCDVCGRGFYKQFLLRQHQRYHSDERPFACEYCEKRFVTSEKQRRHVRTHTGEKPYRCKYCDRAFAQSNDCIKHLRQHLGDNVYLCELCPLRFPLVRDLRAHFASHKNDDDETRSRNLRARMQEEQDLKIKLSSE